MKTFDLENIEIENMSAKEQDEVIEYVLSLDLLEIYNYIFFLLNEKYLLSRFDDTNRAYELLLARREFEPYRNSIMKLVDDEEELIYSPENFPSRKDYLAANIAYINQIYNLDLEDEYYENEKVKLEEFTTEYNSL